MKTISHIVIIFYLSLIGFSACSDNGADLFTEPDLYKLGEYTHGEYTVLAYSDRPLSVGYHTIYIEILEDGVPFAHPHIHFMPMMAKEHHSHSSPHTNVSHQRGISGLFETSAIFTMPGNDHEFWILNITVHDQNHSGFEIQAEIQVGVEPSGNVKIFMTEDETRYFVTLMEPLSPEVGMNDLAVAVHSRSSVMEHPPVLTADIEFEPWMPAMDHGSPNNISPEHIGDGIYQGQVNFNMTGDWELRFQFAVGSEVHPVTFEIAF